MPSLSKLTVPARQPLIAEVVLADAAATIDFQNIPQHFRNLRIALSARGAAAAASINVGVRCNGDATAIYDYELGGFTNVTSTTPIPGVAQTSAIMAQAPAATATANKFAQCDIVVGDYTSTAKHKSMIGRSTVFTSEAAAGLTFRNIGGLWRSTAAITRLTLIDTAGGNFDVGTVATLYGEGRAPLA